MVNGVVRSVELLYHQLLALGHDVRVVTLAQNGHSHEENGILYVGSISAERVYPGVRISAAGALPISHWLDELEAWGPEVIHTQSEFSTFMLAQRVARRCHCPVVHTYHTVYEDYTQYLFFSERLGRMTAEKATRILSGYCSLMLAPTEKVRAMLNRYGVSCPVVTVPTGIDLTAFGPAKDNGEEKARMRAELGIPEGDTVLLSLGRLAAEKNHAQLVRLLAAQPEQSRPWLVFVGDGPARPDLEALTKELKLTDKGNGKYTFTMPASKVEIKATFVKEVETSPFSDVSTSAYYYEAVKWAQEKGITGGIGNGLFGPNQPCTRAQIVTFLWRAAGSPVVNYAMNMSDVPEGSYYAEAVRWALSEGITTGTTENTFSPDSECTRAQAVAFLFRYAASEAVTLQELVSGFSDADSVPGYALPAMNWALAEEIVQGNGSKLMPNDSCTRAQIVTFLFRAYQDK